MTTTQMLVSILLIGVINNASASKWNSNEKIDVWKIFNKTIDTVSEFYETATPDSVDQQNVQLVSKWLKICDEIDAIKCTGSIEYDTLDENFDFYELTEKLNGIFSDIKWQYDKKFFIFEYKLRAYNVGELRKDIYEKMRQMHSTFLRPKPEFSLKSYLDMFVDHFKYTNDTTQCDDFVVHQQRAYDFFLKVLGTELQGVMVIASVNTIRLKLDLASNSGELQMLADQWFKNISRKSVIEELIELRDSSLNRINDYFTLTKNAFERFSMAFSHCDCWSAKHGGMCSVLLDRSL